MAFHSPRAISEAVLPKIYRQKLCKVIPTSKSDRLKVR